MAYSADKKPGELTALTSLATDDVIVVGDTSDASEVAKGITKANLITDLTTSFATAGHNHTGVYAPVLGVDDNYVTDAEKAALHASGSDNQTITNSSDATSHTITLSASGGSVQLVEGSNITLTTTGTGAAGVVTIASTAGGTGNVSKVGTPADNQIGVWTGDGTIEGTAGLTYSANVLGVGTGAAGTVSSNGNQDLVLQTGNPATGNITIGNGASGDIVVASQAGIQLDSVDTASTVTVSNAGTGTITDELNTTNTSTYWNGPTGMSTAEIGLYAASAYFSLVNYGTGADDASEINLINGSTSPAAGDKLGVVSFTGVDSIGDPTIYGNITGTIVDPTNASEDGVIKLGVMTGGTLANELELTGAELYPTTNNGLNLGTSSLAFNKAYTTAIELGHASDTTLSRVSAGVVAVEGNNVVTANMAASAANINTGTSTTVFNTPDALAGSNFGIRYAQCTLNGSTALTTSEKVYFRIPAGLTGMNLVSVSATVGTGAAGSSSSGTPTFTVKNVTDAQQMLSTSLTVDANEYTSATAATAAVINTTYDDVATDDLIEIAVTTAGTGVTYATVTLGFQLP